ncbi:protease complex subunit PrcB family protein [Mobilitalea sibirica]|uniref:Protease complex subunit PrcB family protein n=1 Tax=Mobilitalea sibirica TaxID=1462919 RepID=A0A8J7L249_9FIRM|nr:protease complex subunit PrcB family protein [Mobilitalea sibirica]MBH1939968.1 protease complex subunit PrcB family protein [Mobilitalea sibirica]
MKKMISIKFLMVIFIISLLAGCANTNGAMNDSDELPRVEEDSNTSDDLPKADDVEADKDGEEVSDEVADSEEGVKEPSNQGITVNLIDFDVVDVSTLSEEIMNEIEVLKVNKGYEFWEQEDGSYIILISSGEKTTGGYTIEVEAMEDNEGKTAISVIETEPAKDSMNIMVMSYPYVVVKASGITDNFIIRNQDQEEFTRLSLEDIGMDAPTNDQLGGTMLRFDENPIDYSKPIIGIYKGQMDNHTIEVLVGDMYVPFVADEIDRFLEGIDVEDTIEITVSISPSDQVIVENIEKVK